MSEQPPRVELPSLDLRQSDNFINRYANNVGIQASIWDLKMIFGQLDQTVGANSVIQETGITLPWAQVKILAYLLQLQIVSHELYLGRIVIPQGLITKPSEVPEQFKDQPLFIKISEAAKKLYDEFVAANPEAV